jgi:hypothetical protein
MSWCPKRVFVSSSFLRKYRHVVVGVKFFDGIFLVIAILIRSGSSRFRIAEQTPSTSLVDAPIFEFVAENQPTSRLPANVDERKICLGALTFIAGENMVS